MSLRFTINGQAATYDAASGNSTYPTALIPCTQYTITAEQRHVVRLNFFNPTPSINPMTARVRVNGNWMGASPLETLPPEVTVSGNNLVYNGQNGAPTPNGTFRCYTTTEIGDGGVLSWETTETDLGDENNVQSFCWIKKRPQNSCCGYYQGGKGNGGTWQIQGAGMPMGAIMNGFPVNSTIPVTITKLPASIEWRQNGALIFSRPRTWSLGVMAGSGSVSGGTVPLNQPLTFTAGIQNPTLQTTTYDLEVVTLAMNVTVPTISSVTPPNLPPDYVAPVTLQFTTTAVGGFTNLTSSCGGVTDNMAGTVSIPAGVTGACTVTATACDGLQQTFSFNFVPPPVSTVVNFNPDGDNADCVQNINSVDALNIQLRHPERQPLSRSFDFRRTTNSTAEVCFVAPVGSTINGQPKYCISCPYFHVTLNYDAQNMIYYTAHVTCP